VTGTPDARKNLLPSLQTRPSTSESALDRDLKDVTTSSIEAYRFYADAMSLHDRGRNREEISSGEESITRNFALCWRMAAAHWN